MLAAHKDGTGNTDGQNSLANSLQKDQNIFDNRAGTKKIIRIITVMAYLFSVSFIAIVLSAYYVFLWQPPNPRLMYHTHTINSIRTEFLIQNPDEKRENEFWPENNIRPNFNISTVESQNSDVTPITLQKPSIQITQNENNLIFGKKNSRNSENNQITYLNEEKFSEILKKLPDTKYIDEKKFLLVTAGITKYFKNKNNSLNFNNSEVIRHYKIKRNNTKSVNNQLQDYRWNERVSTLFNEGSYLGKTFTEMSFNQSKLIDKMKTVCTSSDERKLDLSKTKNSSSISTSYPFILTKEDKIFDTQ